MDAHLEWPWGLNRKERREALKVLEETGSTPERRRPALRAGPRWQAAWPEQPSVLLE